MPQASISGRDGKLRRSATSINFTFKVAMHSSHAGSVVGEGCAYGIAGGPHYGVSPASLPARACPYCPRHVRSELHSLLCLGCSGAASGLSHHADEVQMHVAILWLCWRRGAGACLKTRSHRGLRQCQESLAPTCMGQKAQCLSHKMIESALHLHADPISQGV